MSLLEALLITGLLAGSAPNTGCEHAMLVLHLEQRCSSQSQHALLDSPNVWTPDISQSPSLAGKQV